MSTITFDTLKFVKELEAAGVPAAQAEAQARAVATAIGEVDVVTKRDMERLEAKMETRFERLSGEMTLIKWMLGAVLTLAIANFAKQFF